MQQITNTISEISDTHQNQIPSSPFGMSATAHAENMADYCREGEQRAKENW